MSRSEKKKRELKKGTKRTLLALCTVNVLASVMAIFSLNMHYLSIVFTILSMIIAYVDFMINLEN